MKVNIGNLSCMLIYGAAMNTDNDHELAHLSIQKFLRNVYNVYKDDIQIYNSIMFT